MTSAESLDLGICTTVHNYGQYLQDWVGSLLRLTRRPAGVYLLQHGSTDASGDQADAAAAQLRQAGIPAQVVHVHDRLDFGAARNQAIGMAAGHEWVMHLDADDMLLPHALEDVAALAPEADVVALGYYRCRPNGGPAPAHAQRARLYRDSQGQATLNSQAPCSGVSPFRRSFWERSPYPTDQIGGWDTALWLGFAHLGARFKATHRPAFLYRQHADSTFQRRLRSPWGTARAGAQLQARRRGDKGVAVVVPRAAEDGPERQMAWDWVRRRYQLRHPDWAILEETGSAADWCKGEVVQAAAERSTARILVVADADCILSPAALEQAVALVDAGAPWVVPHTMVHRLNPVLTARWLARDPAGEYEPPAGGLMRAPYQGFAGGGCFVVNRACYLAAGGMPRLFVGWGSEDEATALLLDTLLGRHVRLPQDLVHLYHPVGPERTRPTTLANRGIFHRLQMAARDPEALWAMVQQGKRPHLRGAREPNPREATMPDRFAQRKLVQARRRTEAAMAGALENVHEARRKQMAEQARRNAEAHAEKQKRREEAEQLSTLPRERRRRQNLAEAVAATATAAVAQEFKEFKQAAGASENKMEQQHAAAPENKAEAPAPEPEAEAPAAPADPLADVPFASAMARSMAQAAGLTAKHFVGRTPSAGTGFNAKDVRAVRDEKDQA